MAYKIDQSNLQKFQQDKQVFSEYDISDEGMVKFSDPKIDLDINNLRELKSTELSRIDIPDDSNLASEYKNTFIAIEAITNLSDSKAKPEDKISMISDLLTSEGLVDSKDLNKAFDQKSPEEKFTKIRELMELQMKSNTDIFQNVSSEMKFMDDFLFENDDLNKDLTQPDFKEMLDNQEKAASVKGKKPTHTPSHKQAKGNSIK